MNISIEWTAVKYHQTLIRMNYIKNYVMKNKVVPCPGMNIWNNIATVENSLADFSNSTFQHLIQRNEKLYSNKTLYNNFYDNIGNNSNILWWKNVSAKTSKSIQWNSTIQQCKIIEILMHAITRIDNEGIIVNEKSHLGCVVLFLKFLRWQNSRDRQ